jgi:putative nucleotidyltransferase with HDIG domain
MEDPVKKSMWLFSLRAKLLLAFLSLCIVLTGITTVSIYHQIRTAYINSLQQHLTDIAGLASLQIDGDMLDTIISPERQTSEEYLSLHRTLTKIAETEQNIKYIYTMRKTSEAGEYAFIIDADPDPESAAEIGEIYDGRKISALENGFKEPSADTDFVTDQWGTTLSGYAPIYNSEGKVVGVLGIDMDASFINGKLYEYRKKFMLYSLAACLLAMLMSVVLANHLTRRINQVSSAVKEMTEGKLQVAFGDDGADEIGRLKENINRLAMFLCSEREQMLLATIEALVQALEAKDSYTMGHSLQVEEIVTEIARALELPEEEVFKIRFAALLHDVGKIGIPDDVLRKETPLSEQEWELIKQHPTIGERIVSGIPALLDVAHMVKYHHARWDGRGYPEAVSENQIPLGARVIAIADSYQAITSDRPYRKGKSREEALAEIIRCKGTQFDPQIVDVFANLLTNGYWPDTNRH